MFIERLIFDILKENIDALKLKPQVFEDFIFRGVQNRDEAQRAREYFEKHPPTVIQGYPRTDSYFPCYAITLGTESVAQDYIGEDAFNTDILGDAFIDDDGYAKDCHIRRWAHNFDVFTYVDHPDVCLYYYNLAKKILISNKNRFISQDLDNISYNGADMAPDPRYSPEFLFVRRLSLSLQSDWDYTDDENPLFEGYSVEGISVSDGEPLSSELSEQQKSEMQNHKFSVDTISSE